MNKSLWAIKRHPRFWAIILLPSLWIIWPMIRYSPRDNFLSVIVVFLISVLVIGFISWLCVSGNPKGRIRAIFISQVAVLGVLFILDWWEPQWTSFDRLSEPQKVVGALVTRKETVLLPNFFGLLPDYSGKLSTWGTYEGLDASGRMVLTQCKADTKKVGRFLAAVDKAEVHRVQVEQASEFTGSKLFWYGLWVYDPNGMFRAITQEFATDVGVNSGMSRYKIEIGVRGLVLIEDRAIGVTGIDCWT